jgi:predicted Fe-S protein YdhL (DUF1289 family)
MKIESPCKKICKLSNSICIGCGRNIEDIKNWSKYTEEKKKIVLEKIEKY